MTVETRLRHFRWIGNQSVFVVDIKWDSSQVHTVYMSRGISLTPAVYLSQCVSLTHAVEFFQPRVSA